MEQFKSLPKDFTIKIPEDKLLILYQDVSGEKLNDNLIYSKGDFVKAEESIIEYWFENRNRDGKYQILSCNIKGLFSGYTNEKIETRRGLFEIWRNLEIENELTKKVNDFLSRIEKLQLPKEWDGFEITKNYSKKDIMDLLMESTGVKIIFFGRSKNHSFTIHLWDNGRVFLGGREGNIKAKTIEEIPHLIKTFIDKNRLDNIF
jgi:hypothetical protein